MNLAHGPILQLPQLERKSVLFCKAMKQPHSSGLDPFTLWCFRIGIVATVVQVLSCCFPTSAVSAGLGLIPILIAMGAFLAFLGKELASIFSRR